MAIMPDTKKESMVSMEDHLSILEKAKKGAYLAGFHEGRSIVGNAAFTVTTDNKHILKKAIENMDKIRNLNVRIEVAEREKEIISKGGFNDN